MRRGELLRASLLQMIVHDLKNPLTAIMPWLQTVQMGILSREETAEYLQMSVDECEYLLRMIDDLNDVGKMQHEGKLELHREPLELAELLEDVARRLRARASEVGMQIRIEDGHAPGLPPLEGDRNKLRRVLENLVANAVKYGRPPEGSGRPAEVVLRVVPELRPPEEGGNSVRVEVRDYGVGVPLAEADRVFEAYYQAEAGRKRKAGVGLGLAFARMIVAAHGGAIWVEANPEGGSVFAFRLPASG
jgi:two-component system sensor histidine kinase BaeS